MARLGAAASASRLTSASACFQPSGSRPAARRANASRRAAGWASSRAVHAARRAAPRAPAARQAAAMSAGTSKGGASQPSAVLAAATSPAPSGAPCASVVPALAGAPNPIVVRQAISEGRSETRAASIAEATAAGSLPSTRATRQP